MDLKETGYKTAKLTGLCKLHVQSRTLLPEQFNPRVMSPDVCMVRWLAG